MPTRDEPVTAASFFTAKESWTTRSNKSWTQQSSALQNAAQPLMPKTPISKSESQDAVPRLPRLSLPNDTSASLPSAGSRIWWCQAQINKYWFRCLRLWSGAKERVAVSIYRQWVVAVWESKKTTRLKSPWFLFSLLPFCLPFFLSPMLFRHSGSLPLIRTLWVSLLSMQYSLYNPDSLLDLVCSAAKGVRICPSSV